MELRTGFKRLAEWVFPLNCAACGQPLKIVSGHLCKQCNDSIVVVKNACPICARPDTTGLVCGHCQKQPPHFDETITAGLYREPLSNMIKEFKFANRLARMSVLTELLLNRIRADNHDLPDLIVPVPLHEARMRRRGYNQSLEIARSLARELRLPIDPVLLKRVKRTQPQTGLRHKQRTRNVRNAFVTDHPPEVTHIALVDDVMTTASTMNECAKSLKLAGVSRVSAWVVARAG